MSRFFWFSVYRLARPFQTVLRHALSLLRRDVSSID